SQPPGTEPEVPFNINSGQSAFDKLERDDPVFPILIGEYCAGVHVPLVDVKQGQILARLLEIFGVNLAIFVFLHDSIEFTTGEDVVSDEAKLLHDTAKRPQAPTSSQRFEIYWR